MKVKTLIRRMVGVPCFLIFNKIYSNRTPLKENQVCFLAETHKELNGNQKAVYERLKDEHPELELLVYTREDRRDKRTISERLAIWKAISSAGCLVLDDLYKSTAHMNVREGQDVIQLWHGAGAYKKFGHSRSDLSTTITGRRRVHKGYKKYTKAIVSGSKIAWCYAEAFGIDEAKVKATGIPRMDHLYDKEYIEATKERFLREHENLRGKKLILFAPTYRGTLVGAADYGFEEANLNKLATELGDDYIIMTRWHPALKNNIERGNTEVRDCDFGEHIMDFSDYPDVNDLLIACDIMVTDYSSIIFDYFPLEKPIVYFAYDKEEYAGDRGLYYDFDTYVYGDVAENYQELLEAIKAEHIYQGARDNFCDLFLDSCDGNSTDRVCRLILNKDAD